MKRLLVTMVAVLAVTACGSRAPHPQATAPTPTPTEALPPTEAPVTTTASPSPEPGGTAAPATAPTLSATQSPSAAPAVSPVDAPLRLGVVASDRDTFQRLLAARRTLGGRTVIPVWVTSCAGLTWVDLALVQGQACAGTSFPVLAAGPGVGELTSTLTSLTTLTVDDRVRLVLDRALTPKTGSLGVVVESCPVNQRAVTKVLVPRARQRGFTIAATASVPCGQAARAGSTVAALQAKKAAQVVFVSGEDEAGLLRAFTKAAAAKRYAPQYGVTSAAAPATLADQSAQVVGVGWLPALDTSAVAASGEINDCLRAVRRAGATAPTTPGQRFATYGACDLLSLADRVLRLTHGSTDVTAVRSALKATGRLFKAASVLDSATDFRTRQTGPARGSTFAWSPGCRCYAYTGDRFAL